MIKSLFYTLKAWGWMIAVFVGLPLHAQENVQSLFDSLQSIDNLHLIISTDIKNLVDEKYKDEYQAAMITVDHEDLAGMKWPARVKARGVYRKRICDFPPIMINFKNDLSDFLGVEEMGSLKLVTSCQKKLIKEELIEKENLMYLIYNQLTHESFRTKMLSVTWVDSQGGPGFKQDVNFLIESKDGLARRLGGKEVERIGISADSLDMTSAVRSSLFQYMIGNTDWSLNQAKNLAMVQMDSTGMVKVVPYDFDFCYAVGAPYLRTDSALNLRYASDRIYLGPIKEDVIAKQLELFASYKNEVFDIIKNCPELSSKGKRGVRSYIASFFNEMDKPVRYPSYYQDASSKKE